MKKALLGLGAAVIASCLITPKFIAAQVQTNISRITEQVNQLPGYSAKITELNSGWFTTNAQLTVNFDVKHFTGQINELPNPIDQFAIKLNVNAEHGPILTSSEHLIGLSSIEVTLANEELREQLEWLENTPLYQVKIFNDLSGDFSYVDQIESFSAKTAAEDFAVSFAGYQGSGVLSNNQWHYQGVTQPIIFNTDQGKLTLSAIKVDMQLATSFTELLNSSLYDSDTTFNINSMTFENKDQQQLFSANNAHIQAVSKVNNEKNTGDIAITYGLDKVTIEQFSAQDLALTIEMNNISKAFVEAYQKNVMELTSGSEQDVEAKVQAFITEHLLALLAAEPELNIASLRGTLKQGSFTSSVNSRLTGINALPDNIADAQFWLSHLLADGKLQGDKAVIEYFATLAMKSQLKQNPQAAEMTDAELEQVAMQQVPQVLQMLIEQGLIKRDENSYNSTFAFKDKVLTVNNKPMPLPM